VADIAAQLGAALRDRYLLERELGRGGMAMVYLARDLKHDRGSPPAWTTRTSSRCTILARQADARLHGSGP
jgi:hypothetical protein